MERVMKVMQWLATVVLVLAGVTLLVQPLTAHAQAAATAGRQQLSSRVPTRFTVIDEGTVGKPDVVLIPGLGSSRAVWDGEVKLLAPNYRLHLVQVDGFAGAPAGANSRDLYCLELWRSCMGILRRRGFIRLSSGTRWVGCWP